MQAEVAQLLAQVGEVARQGGVVLIRPEQRVPKLVARRILLSADAGAAGPGAKASPASKQPGKSSRGKESSPTKSKSPPREIVTRV